MIHSRELGNFLGLFKHRLQDLGVNVSLVASAIASEAVKVATPFAVPYVYALTTLKGHRERPVVLAERTLVQVHVVAISLCGCLWSKRPKWSFNDRG